jgi:hypothetical protein
MASHISDRWRSLALTHRTPGCAWLPEVVSFLVSIATPPAPSCEMTKRTVMARDGTQPHENGDRTRSGTDSAHSFQLMPLIQTLRSMPAARSLAKASPLRRTATHWLRPRKIDRPNPNSGAQANQITPTLSTPKINEKTPTCPTPSSNRSGPAWLDVKTMRSGSCCPRLDSPCGRFCSFAVPRPAPQCQRFLVPTLCVVDARLRS